MNYLLNSEKELVVIKLGGAALLDDSIREHVLSTITQYQKYDYHVVLVHGGGPAINAELNRLGITWEFVNGLRKTTTEMVHVIDQVLSSVNAKLVQDMQSMNLPSVGLNGNSEILNCSVTSSELGWVGTIENINVEPILNSLHQDKTIIPVIAPIGVDTKGNRYNINADWAAAKLASSLKAKKLIYLTDQFGILNENKNIIPFVSDQDLEKLILNGTVSGGMHTKVLTVLDALKNGVNQVRIMHGSEAKNG
jgi:acetylglutamate kinase